MDKRALLKRMAPVALAAFLGYGAACATQSAVSRSTAQQPPQDYQRSPQGQPAGGYGAGGQTAARGFSECFGARVWQISGRAVNNGEIGQTVRVPPGWTPVGGGAIGSDGLVILCR